MRRPSATPVRGASRLVFSTTNPERPCSPSGSRGLQLLPQIEAREKSGTAVWLDLTLKTGAPPLEGQKFQAGDNELEFRPCPAPEAAE